jgi:hypothetical protein
LSPRSRRLLADARERDLPSQIEVRRMRATLAKQIAVGAAAGASTSALAGSSRLVRWALGVGALAGVAAGALVAVKLAGRDPSGSPTVAQRPSQRPSRPPPPTFLPEYQGQVWPDFLTADDPPAPALAVVADAGPAAAQCPAEPAPVCRPAGLPDDLRGRSLEPIDDLEDGDRAVLPISGRTGKWNAAHDDSPGAAQAPDPFKPTEIGACGNRFAAHIAGCGFRRYSNLYFDFSRYRIVDGSPTTAPLDISRYTGVRFWARSARGTRIFVSLPNRDTDPRGRVCNATDAGSGPTSGCHASFGRFVDLVPEWRAHELRFAELRQSPYFGMRVAHFDTNAVYGVLFAIDTSSKRPATFDLWVDDVSFLTD